jgi:hypothetical protein
MSLIGTWKQIQPFSREENIYLKFESDGTLLYQAELTEKTQQINLTYEVVENCIISNQPSKPREERTEFFFEGNDLLVLVYEGRQSKYLRQSSIS